MAKDLPKQQRNFANSRGWRFRLVSHGGGDYIQEQSVMEGSNNMPGAVVYERDIRRFTARMTAYLVPGIFTAPCGVCWG